VKVAALYCSLRSRTTRLRKRARTCMNGMYQQYSGSIETSTELIAGSLITRLDLARKYDGRYSTGASILRRKI